MFDSIRKNEQAGFFSKRQQLFIKYTFFVLIDLCVLNLFHEFWDAVYVESFSVSLLVAILLQALLQITIAIEHRVAKIFKDKEGLKNKILRMLSTWFVLFVSKLIILEAIDFAFGEGVAFGGAGGHGLLAFIIVIVVMVVFEQIFVRTYKSLGK